MMTDFRAISTPGAYDGAPVTVPAGDCALIGPFAWSPTQADLGGTQDGHRCLLAAITSDLDPGPAVSPTAWIPADDDNVTQRNIQVSELEFFVRNTTGTAAQSEIRLDMGTFPTATSGASFELLVDDPTGALEAAWQGTPGVVLSREGTNVVVTVQTSS